MQHSERHDRDLVVDPLWKSQPMEYPETSTTTTIPSPVSLPAADRIQKEQDPGLAITTHHSIRTEDFLAVTGPAVVGIGGEISIRKMNEMNEVAIRMARSYQDG